MTRIETSFVAPSSHLPLGAVVSGTAAEYLFDASAFSASRLHSSEQSNAVRQNLAELLNRIELKSSTNDAASNSHSYRLDIDAAFEQMRRERNRQTLRGEFDEVYLVNLKRETGKRLGSIKHLNAHGIWPLLWDASNGYQSPLREEFHEYQQRELGQLHYSQYNSIELQRGSLLISSAGAWGYIRTYESIIRHAQANGYRRVLILEDDVLLGRRFASDFARVMEAVPKDWKVLQFGASQYDWECVGDLTLAASKGCYECVPLHTCGSFAMAIDQSIYSDLLDALKPMDSPFDFIPLGQIYEQHSGHCFVAFPNVIVPDVRSSSIRSSRDQLEHAERMKWPMPSFDFPRPLVSATILFAAPDQLALNIGSNLLEQHFDINWLYYHRGEARPIHSWDDVQRLRPTSGDSLVSIDEIESSLSNAIPYLTTDFVVTLDPNKAISERSLIELFESLVRGSRVEMEGCRVQCLGSRELEIASAADQLAVKSILHDSLLNSATCDSHEASPSVIRWIKSQAPPASEPASPLVSVIIPTYRRPEHLQQAVQSVLEQTYTAIEVLVVDDNDPSSDERAATEAAIQSLLSDPRVRYIKHAVNLGGSAARNTGLMQARGCYVSFLDDDDVYLPRKTQACVDAIESLDRHVGGVYTGFSGWNSSDNDPERYREGKLTNEILGLEHTKHYLCTNTALYRRSALLKINGYDESFKRHQDMEMNLRFFEQFEMGVVPEILVRIRPTPTPVSNLLDGPRLLEVKRKFLGKYRHLIERLPAAHRERVYEAHWNEVIKYFGGKKAFLEHLRSSGNADIASSVVATFDSAVAELAQGKVKPLTELLPSRETDATIVNEGMQATVSSALGADWNQTGSLSLINDLIRSMKGDGPTACQIRDLPRLLCFALDARRALLRNDLKRARLLLSEIRPMLNRQLGWLMRTCLHPHQTATNPVFEDPLPPEHAAAIRELILGPIVSKEWYLPERIQFGFMEPIGWYHSLALHGKMSELIVPSQSNFTIGKFECVAARPHGVLLHPNSDSQLVWVELRSPAGESGVMQGLIVQLRNKDVAPAMLYASRTKDLNDSLVAEIAPGTESQLIPFPMRERVKDDRWFVGVRVPSGEKPGGVHLTITGVLLCHYLQFVNPAKPVAT